MNIFCILVLIVGLSSFTSAQTPVSTKSRLKSVEILQTSWKKANRLNRPLDSHSTFLQNNGNPPDLFVGKGYEYTLKIKNNTGKRIKSIKWSFEFLDPVTLEKIDSHEFTSERKISAGKTRKLIEFSVSPPTKIVDALLIEKAGVNPYKEVIVIQRIEYSDGSVWTPN
jgi:hypothetical protein